MTNSPSSSRNTAAFYAQAGISFAIALMAMLFAILYLPVDPWVRAFLGLGTLYLTLAPHDVAHAFADVEYVQMGIVALLAVGAAALPRFTEGTSAPTPVVDA